MLIYWQVLVRFTNVIYSEITSFSSRRGLSFDIIVLLYKFQSGWKKSSRVLLTLFNKKLIISMVPAGQYLNYDSIQFFNRYFSCILSQVFVMDYCSEKVVTAEIPASMEALVAEKRRELIETVSEVDDKLADMFLSDEPISSTELEVWWNGYFFNNKISSSIIYVFSYTGLERRIFYS